MCSFDAGIFGLALKLNMKRQLREFINEWKKKYVWVKVQKAKNHIDLQFTYT